MCGLFGYVGPVARIADLGDVALLSARRGPDSWGVYIDGKIERGGGRLNAAVLDFLAPGAVILGVARLATILGSGPNIADAQPVYCAGIALAHNGSVYNYAALRGRFAGVLRTTNDSEVLAAAIAAARGPGLAERVRRALSLIEHRGHYALAATDGDEVFICALGQQLFASREHGYLRWSSVRPEGAAWQAVGPGGASCKRGNHGA